MVELFEDRFKRLCEMRGLSIPQVCEKAGINYKTLNAQISRNSRIPVDTIDEICHALDVPMEYFSRYAPSVSISPPLEADGLSQAAAGLLDAAMHAAHIETLRQHSKITTMDVLNWLRQTGARLEDFDALKESVDLFHVMGSEDNIPTPYRIGRKSLATQQFEIDDETHYLEKIGSMHPELLENIKKGRMEASYVPYMICDVEIKGLVGGKMVSINYCRLTAKVYLPNGEELTLVHAEQIPNSRVRSHKTHHLDLIQPPPNHSDDLQAG